MPQRPLLNKSVAELEAYFAANKNNLQRLNEIITELSFRSTHRGLTLADQVKSELLTLVELKSSQLVDDYQGEAFSHLVSNLNETKFNQVMNEHSETQAEEPMDLFESVEQRKIEAQKQAALSDDIASPKLGKDPRPQETKMASLPHSRLQSLIEFVQASAKLKSVPLPDVSKHGDFIQFEHQIQGLPAIHFDMDANEQDIWMAIERLKEIPVPSAKSEILAVWLDAPDNPIKQPSLKAAVETAKLIKAGLIPSDYEGEEKTIALKDLVQTAEIEGMFRNYLASQWVPWADVEKKRRQTIQLYGKLFAVAQQLKGDLSAAEMELIWGTGIVVWEMDKTKVSYPLITKSVEVVINPFNHNIEIRPRDVDPVLELEIFAAADNPNVPEIQQAYKRSLIDAEPYSPFLRSSFDGILRTAAGLLHSGGSYWPDMVGADDRALPPTDKSLKITDTWVLAIRPRNKNLLVQDLEKFRQAIEDNEIDLPAALLAILIDPVDFNTDIEMPSYRGISMVGASNDFGSEPSDLFFPKPFNEEQVRIVQLLDSHDGVVVQGPPGTGKTHTIANVISHYFALGKRVLVTSMKEPALVEVRNKLPEEIRPLAVSLLTNEQEGLKQFGHAISKIASEMQTIDRIAYRREVAQLEGEISSLHGQLGKLDKQINDWAVRNLTAIQIDGIELKPIEAAREVIGGNGEFEWLTDKIYPQNTPLFDNSDVARIRAARRDVGVNIAYINRDLPPLSELPPTSEILRIHENLSRHTEIEAAVNSGELPALKNADTTTLEELHALDVVLERLQALSSQIKETGLTWPANAARYLAKSDDNTAPIIEAFDSLGHDLREAASDRRKFLSRPVLNLSLDDLEDELLGALENKSQGKSPFGLMGLLGKAPAKKKLEQIRVVNEAPSRDEDWLHVYEFALLQKRQLSLLVRWNTIAPEIGIDSLEPTDLTQLARALDFYALHLEVRENAKLRAELSGRTRSLFPTWTELSALRGNEAVSVLRDAVKKHTLSHALSSAREEKARIFSGLSRYDSPVTNEIKSFLRQSLGNPEIVKNKIEADWAALVGELKDIHSLRPKLAEIDAVSKLIEDSGAPDWAIKLKTISCTETVDPLILDIWRKAWRLRSLSNYLDDADVGDKLKALNHERLNATHRLEKCYGEIVAKRTWLKVAENATPMIRGALEAYRNAIAKIGKTGKGKKAAIARQEARAASGNASQAVPCWIMPHWRVSESLPADFGCFDLVIIDEASQSDLTALPAILRAHKVLIVGDEKQISPDGTFIEIDKIQKLKDQYLGQQVPIYKGAMNPEQSIYDLFKVVFASSSTMLKEHFRCVGPIIEYSKREVYNHELKPLRIPLASERLDPPLVDVLVEDGYRKGDINDGEARFIVSEIKKIAADETLKNRSIGVVSLIANKQAQKILAMLEAEIGFDGIERHQIVCGDAYTFQGKEKDIMFLSMIVSAGDAHAQTTDSFEKRLNVAASRARDRMYLVRSIEKDQLSPSDKLRGKLIDHFSTPFVQNEKIVEDLRTLCESDFEREVYDLLIERGYRVTPQVKAGRYRIDMVVEGHRDMRLAVECDGDQYHGADKWDDDMARQRVLERAGWKFWRCFASEFVRNPKAKIEDLINTLTSNGIEPIGSETAPRSLQTEFRKVCVYSEDFQYEIADEQINEEVKVVKSMNI